MTPMTADALRELRESINAPQGNRSSEEMEDLRDQLANALYENHPRLIAALALAEKVVAPRWCPDGRHLKCDYCDVLHWDAANFPHGKDCALSAFRAEGGGE